MEVSKNLELEELWYRYYKLIYKLCSKYQFVNPIYNIDDLLSESYIILNDIYKLYDDTKAEFITYLFRSLNNRLWSITNGHSSKDQGNYKLINSVLSLDAPLDDEGDSTLIDVLEDATAEENFNLPEKMFLYDLRKAEEEALQQLRPNQREIVKALNGIDSAVYSQAELGRIRGVTKERIRQIMNDSYRKLRLNDKLIKIWNEEHPDKKYTKKYNVRIKNDWNY